MISDVNTELIKDGFLGQRMVYMPGTIKKKIKQDKRINDLYITHIGHFPKAKGHFRHRKFGCQQYILIYCKEGEGWIILDKKKFILKENSIFIIPPNIRCMYGASIKSPWNNYWIHFTGDNAQLYSPEAGKILSIPTDINARIEDRFMLFEEMLINIEQYSNFNNVIYANICLKYFLTSIRQIDNYRLAGEKEAKSYLNLALSYMNNNLKKKISLQDICQACQCSKSNLNKVFSKNMHCTPMDYFIQIKIQRACRYLIHSDRKIKNIALNLGYDDPYYFSRLFSKIIGKSPSKYRSEERGE